MMERLQKFLARAGVASRRHAETFIVAGRVKVNGRVVSELGSRVDPQKDLVLLDGKLVSPSSERKYFLFYKPPGVVTTLSDPEGRPTIADYAREAGGRVFPVGRLDYDAEGALLLTDDGELANKLMHPSHQVPRVYLAKVKGEPDEPSLQKLVDGVRLEDGPAKALVARIFEKAERNTWVKLVVSEGRQHLVKRLCAAIGHPVLRLYRPAHASISVQGLRPGELRALTNDEIRRVKAAADGDAQPEPPMKLPARRHGHAAPGFEPIRDEDDEQGPSQASERPRRGPGPSERQSSRSGSQSESRPRRDDARGESPWAKRSKFGERRTERAGGAPERARAEKGPRRDGGSFERSRSEESPRREGRPFERSRPAKGPRREGSASERSRPEAGARREGGRFERQDRGGGQGRPGAGRRPRR